MRVIATMCSRAKRSDTAPLPAYERYLGEHVAQVRALAHQGQRPFFIFSGKFGLIPADQKIPDYDHRLEMQMSYFLSIEVAIQLTKYNIRHVDFWVEDKPGWAVYRQTLARAAEFRGVEIVCPPLPTASPS